jgi:hypothetical protein
MVTRGDDRKTLTRVSFPEDDKLHTQKDRPKAVITSNQLPRCVADGVSLGAFRLLVLLAFV